MKQKITTIVLGVLGLSLITGCNCLQTTSSYGYVKCFPCENAKAARVAPVPVSNCFPCQQTAPQYVAPTPQRVYVQQQPMDCLDCTNGQPDYSRYQWY